MVSLKIADVKVLTLISCFANKACKRKKNGQLMKSRIIPL